MKAPSTPAEPEGDDAKLAGYLAKAHDEHALAVKALSLALYHAYEAGRMLRRCKKLVGHSNWLDWLGDNFNASKETAALYMRIARNWTKGQQIKKFIADNPDVSLEAIRQRLRKRGRKTSDKTKRKGEIKRAREAMAKRFRAWTAEFDEDTVMAMRLRFEDLLAELRKLVEGTTNMEDENNAAA